ncbi:diguanylate cyclase domain-containing protein [Planktothrix sp. FACHB-1365]|uniref:diguanylate cyclase domain-containing protein n=1 Tax=Planktothrix sp. FACHB-1365 TaxID=2692855 RepID=UPI0016848856|nr:diguanylate cyclase [Planktothrix sp. FACHB-1365]MBD2483097.1 diguanylate cyclase [Planktothrix sp. FACHB-1365]
MNQNGSHHSWQLKTHLQQSFFEKKKTDFERFSRSMGLDLISLVLSVLLGLYLNSSVLNIVLRDFFNIQLDRAFCLVLAGISLWLWYQNSSFVFQKFTLFWLKFQGVYQLACQILQQFLPRIFLMGLFLRGLIFLGFHYPLYSREPQEMIQNLTNWVLFLIFIGWIIHHVNYMSYGHSQAEDSNPLELKQNLPPGENDTSQPQEKLYQALLSAPYPMMLHTKDGEVIEINQSWAEITGYTVAQLPTISAWSERLTNPEPLPSTKNLVGGSRLPERRRDYLITNHQGYLRIWEWSSLTFGQLTDGKTLLLSTIVDITEDQPTQTFIQQSQQSNEQLQLSLLQWTAELTQANDGLQEELQRRQQMTSELYQVSERLKQLLRSSPAVIFSCQPQPHYQITFISDNVYTLLGYEVTTFLKEENIWHDYVPEEEKSQWQDAFIQVLTTGTYIHEARFLHAQGHWRWLRLEMRLIKDGRGNPLEIVGYFVDITDRKEAEMQLLTTQNRLKTVIETVGNGIMLSDEQGNFYLFNPQMTEITGYTLEEAQSHSDFLALLYPTPEGYQKAQDRLKKVIATGSIFNLETTIQAKNGQLKTLLLSTVMMQDQQHRLFLSTFQDITPLKRAEKALCQLIVQEHLIWEITHQIRQSLNLDDILNATVKEVQQLLECDQVLIYRIFPDRRGKIIAETEPDESLKFLRNRQSETPLIPLECYENFNQGRMRVINDINHDPIHSGMLKVLKYWGICSAIMVPLFEQNQLWGLLMICQNHGLRHWLQWEATLLRQISEQVGIALQQSQLYQQTQYQARRAQTLNHVIQFIRQSLDLDTIFSTAVAEIVTLLRVDRACILQHLPQEEQWKEVASYSYDRNTTPAILSPIQQLNHLETEDLTVPNSQEIQHLTGISGTWLPIPLRVGSQVWGCLGLLKHQHLRGWKESEIELTCAIADQLAIAIQQSELYQELQVANQQLKRQATVDGLTQVANRRRFDEYLEQEWQRLQREQGSLALIMCDIDYFKQYNDYYGHPAGDSCLKQVAQAIENTLRRPADLVARYGGEEFAIILPNTNQDGAIHVAQHIQAAVLQLEIPHDKSTISQWLTLSLGVACTLPSPLTSFSVLIEAADQVLYQAKQQGRARYCVQPV